VFFWAWCLGGGVWGVGWASRAPNDRLIQVALEFRVARTF
jgi:hypothetical protein